MSSMFGVLQVQLSQGQVVQSAKVDLSNLQVEFEFPSELVCNPSGGSGGVFSSSKPPLFRSDRTDSLQFRYSAEVPLQSELTGNHSVTVKVLRNPLIGSSTRVGAVSVPLEVLATGGGIENQGFMVSNERGEQIFRLPLRIVWKPGTQPASIANAGANGADGAQQPSAAGAALLASNPGQRLLPLPDCANQDYTVRVKVHGCRNLQSLKNDKLYNSRAIATACGRSERTSVQQETNEPVFDEELTFHFEKVGAQFWTEVLQIQLVSDRMALPDEPIGSLIVDLGAIYRANQQHAIVKKWFVLLKSTQEGTVMGYVKLSLAVQNQRLDDIVEFDDDDDEGGVRDGSDGDEDFTANLINAPGAAYEELTLHADIEKAEGLPKMDSGALGTCDPYVKLRFGKKSVETVHINSTYTPSFKAHLQLPLLLPALASTVFIELWDYDATSPDDLIATHKLDVNALITENARSDGLPRMSPRYINFYGHPRSCDADFNRYYKEMAGGVKAGVDYRGRALMRFDGSRSKNMSAPMAPKEMFVDVGVTVELMMLSQLAANEKYKVKVMCAGGSASSQFQQAEKMINYDGYFAHLNQKVTFNVKLPVVLPQSDTEVDALAAFTACGDEQREIADAPLQKRVERFVWQQIPDLIVHLIIDSRVDKLAAALTGQQDEDPVAAVVVSAEKLWRAGGCEYMTRTMCLTKDPDSVSPGTKMVYPLLQMNAGMRILTVSAQNDISPSFGLPPAQVMLNDAPRRPYSLDVCVYHARNVPAGDDNGLSDPYLTVSWGNAGARTGTKLETLHPTWNELLQIIATVKEPLPSIVLELWDYDTFGGDTYLAKTYLRPTDIPNTPFWAGNWTDCYGRVVPDCAVLIALGIGPATEEKIQAVKNPRKVPMPMKVGSRKTYMGIPLPPEVTLNTAQFAINLDLLGLRGMRRFRNKAVLNPHLEFELYEHSAVSPAVTGKDANFNRRLSWTVTLPKNDAYKPSLTVRLFENRLRLKSLVASATVDLTDPRFNRVARLAQDAAAEQETKERVWSVQESLRLAAEAEEAANEDEADGELEAAALLEMTTSANPALSKSMRSAKGDDDPSPRASVNNNNNPDADGGDAVIEMDELRNRKGGVPAKKKDGGFLSLADVGPLAAIIDMKKRMGDALEEQAEEAEDAMSVTTAASTEPDEPFWYDRFDPQSALDPRTGEPAEVKPTARVARFGKICRTNPQLQGGRTTAEHVLGPFDDGFAQIPLYRGWGTKRTKAGELLVDGTMESYSSAPFASTPAADSRATSQPSAAAVVAPANAVPHWASITPRQSTPVMVRVYIVGCRELRAMDDGPLGRSSDPYVVLSLCSGGDLGKKGGGGSSSGGGSSATDVTVTCRDQIRYQTLNPEYFFCRELSGTLPTHRTLRVTVMDWDRVGSDEVIGATDINLESRYFGRGGYRTPPPTDPEDARTFFSLNRYGSYTERRLLRNSNAQASGSIELWIDVFDFKTPVPRPIDIAPPPPIPMELRCVVWNVRDCELTDEAITGEQMTDIYVRCYVDGMRGQTQATDTHYRSLDGSGSFNWRMNFPLVFDPRQRKVFAAPAALLKGRDADAAPAKAPGIGEKLGALARSAAADESGGAASTAGGFSLFSVRKEEKRLTPRLHVQIFDNDLFPGTDDFIGEANLKLLEMVPTMGRRSQTGLMDDIANMGKSLVQCWPLGKIFTCGCCKEKLEAREQTLKDRQELAAKERLKEKALRKQKVERDVAMKMLVVQASSYRFSQAEMASIRRRLTKAAKRSLQVNVFHDFLPTRVKKSDQMREDAKYAASISKMIRADDVAAGASSLLRSVSNVGKGSKVTQGTYDAANDAPQDEKDALLGRGSGGASMKGLDPNEVPAFSETPRYWFACRSPNGGYRIGDVQLSFQLVRLDALQADPKLAAGKGRSEPQALPDPDRPASSFFWLSSPWKSAVHILWKNYKWYLFTVVCLVLSALFAWVFLARGVKVKADKVFA